MIPLRQFHSRFIHAAGWPCGAGAAGHGESTRHGGCKRRTCCDRNSAEVGVWRRRFMSELPDIEHRVRWIIRTAEASGPQIRRTADGADQTARKPSDFFRDSGTAEVRPSKEQFPTLRDRQCTRRMGQPKGQGQRRPPKRWPLRRQEKPPARCWRYNAGADDRDGWAAACQGSLPGMACHAPTKPKADPSPPSARDAAGFGMTI